MRKSGAMIKIITAAVIAAAVMVVGIADMINASNIKSKLGIILFLTGFAALVLLTVISIILKKKPSHSQQKASQNNTNVKKIRVRNMPQHSAEQHGSDAQKPVQPSPSDPENFFESIDRRSSENKEEQQPKPKLKLKPKPEPESKPASVPQPEPVAEKEMSGLDTDALNLDGLDDLEKPAVSPHASVISSAGDMNGVDLSGLDTDSLGSYTISTDLEESGTEYYSNDDYYTVDAESSEIKLSEMDE
ncbi:MAG: hypothetical protein MRZ61_08115 [Oscillospiraceae bacterium]|nr:hypothetical protein [Oscillospiraceae bacterium]